MPGVAFNTPEPPILSTADPIEALPAAVVTEACPAPIERPTEHRKRARKPAGTDEGGEFQADDPSTPDVNEAWAD